MSKIIYLKDILLAKAKKNKKTAGRPRLKPFKQDVALKSSLVERKVEKDEQQRG